MRSLFSWMSALILGLAALLWVTAPGSAQHRGHDSGHRGGGGHFSPAIGTIRHEHYEAPGYRGGYRNPYSETYFRRFRPGYRPIFIGDAQYYVYDLLPPGCQPVVINGITYYLCGGVYYQPYIYGGRTVYLVPPG